MSASSFTIYQKAQKMHGLITDSIIKLSKLVAIPVFTAAAMFPVLEAIFDFPPPELWRLPLQIRLVPLKNQFRQFTELKIYMDHCSSLISHDKYSQFYADWTLELLCVIGYFAFFLTMATLFAWFYLFINGMVEDLKAQLIGNSGQFNNSTEVFSEPDEIAFIASNFKQAIQSHADIIERVNVFFFLNIINIIKTEIVANFPTILNCSHSIYDGLFVQSA